MKRILVPTDFSECAKAASEVAMALAQKAQAEIYFLHICPDVAVSLIGTLQLQKETIREAAQSRKELNVLVNEAESLGLKATPVLIFDSGNEKIENYTRPYRIDLIVMGSQGASGIREFVLGSNTQRVIRHVQIPVLVIKERPAPIDFKSIVFASTFKEDVDQAFKEVAAFARLLNAMVHLVFVNFIDHLTERAEAEARMKDLASKFPDITCSTNIAETNDEEWAIHQFAIELDADIISLTTHDKDGFIRFLAPSVAEELVNHENKPVLVLR